MEAQIKVLGVGSGGREHALAWKLAMDGARVISVPGNPGMHQVGHCYPAKVDDIPGLVAIRHVVI